MKIKVINLERRPDKLNAFKEKAIQYGYWDHTTVHPGNDGSQYPTADALIGAMALEGWYSESHWDLDVLENGIVAENIPEWGVVDPKSHLAIRWTYLEILTEITEADEDTIVLMDDQFLCVQPDVCHDVLKALKNSGGIVMALDPVEERLGWYAAELTPGYQGITEEAILWTPEGAKQAIPFLVDHSAMVIGDALRKYWNNKAYSTPVRIAMHIGNKKDWKSDVHLRIDNL